MNARNACTIIAAIGLSLAVSASARADTTDVKSQSWLVVAKDGAHCVDDPNCFNRYHPAIKPVARARPGQLIVFETRDALDSDLNIDSAPEDAAAVDLNLVHPMTGPVYIEGARRGDVLAVRLVDIKPDEYGYTVIIPGFGFLRDKFPDPFVANWSLTRLEAKSDQIPGVTIPMNAFMGSVGILPGDPEVDAILAREAMLAGAGGFVLTPQPTGALPADICGPEGSDKDRCLRTIPPRENGGNMDVKQMQVGTTLLLPCFIDGCGLFVGDVHYAQGDGEVSGTAIEMGATVTVVTEVRKGLGAFVKVPHYEGGDQLKALAPSEFYATTGFPLKSAGEVPAFLTYLDGEKIGPLENLSENLALAARNALLSIIDYMVRTKGLTREQAYIVSSVAVDLRIGQLVDVPNYIVSAILPLTIFED
jgi:formamidase